MKTGYSFIVSVLFVLLLVSPVVGSSEDWVEYGRSNSGGVLLYNKVNIKHRTKGIVQVWCKLIYYDEDREEYIQRIRNRGESTKEYDKLSHTVYLLEIDCKKKRCRVLSRSLYKMDDNILSSYSSDKKSWGFIPPYSSIETLRDKVCVTKKKPLKKK